LPIVPYDFCITPKKVVKVYALSAYKDPLRSLILSKHTGNETNIRFLAEIMSQDPILQHLNYDFITFIPLHWTRYAARGFNQAEIIAQTISKKTGKMVIPLIIRSKKTQFQAKIALNEREANVFDAFKINPSCEHQIIGKKILVVDDLFTTGATIKAVSLLLFPYNPKQIDLFVASRVIS